MYCFFTVLFGLVLANINLAVVVQVLNALNSWHDKVVDPSKRRLDSAGNPILSRTPSPLERLFRIRAIRIVYSLFYLLILLPTILIIIFGPFLGAFVAESIAHRVSRMCNSYHNLFSQNIL
jgi:hypothetical protein